MLPLSPLTEYRCYLFYANTGNLLLFCSYLCWSTLSTVLLYRHWFWIRISLICWSALQCPCIFPQAIISKEAKWITHKSQALGNRKVLIQTGRRSQTQLPVPANLLMSQPAHITWWLSWFPPVHPIGKSLTECVFFSFFFFIKLLWPVNSSHFKAESNQPVAVHT